MTFSMHFTIDLDLDRKIAYSKIYGTWKKETAEAYFDEFVKAAAPLIGQRWARLANLTNWKSSYPEMIRVVGEHHRWCRENGMILSVFIIDNPITKAQLKKICAIGGTTKMSKMVRTREDAERILVENGF
jgi:hypothetical protein